MNPLERLRIPTLLGLAIIILGTGTGVYLILRHQTVTTEATVDNTPQKVAISNITDSSITVTWQTPTKIGSFVSYGLTNPNQTVVDDRDSAAPISRVLHIATIRGLTPQTSYNFKVVAGKFTSPVSQFQTTGSISPNSLKPVIGSVLDGNQPLGDGLVFLDIPGATTQVTTIKSLGNFIIPLGLVKLGSSSTGHLLVTSEDGRWAEAKINLNSDGPIGPLKIGQNLDLTQKPAQLGIQINKFDLNGDKQVSTADYSIVNKNLNKKVFDKKADLNSDRKVDKIDLDLILAEIKKNSK